MKKFLSVLLAVMMVFSSTVSYAAPSLAGTADTAVEVPVYEVPAEPADEEQAELSAVDTTEYGELVVRFTFDNVTVGINYIDGFHLTDRNNELADLGGVLGSGTHMRSGVNANIPFIYDGTNGSTERHTSAYGRQDAEGNKYIEFTGTGSATRFAIRDYNGNGLANAGHYILTADVLTASNTKPITGAEFQGNGGKFKHTEYVDETVTAGEWSTVVISYDDTHDVVTTETDYTSTQNTKANYIYIMTSLASGEVLGVDNVTLWWVPAEVSFNVTHDVEGVLEDSTVTIGGGIKTIEELEALIDPNDAFANAGYYLAGFRDEDGFYTDSVLFNESGKSYTAVWDKLNILFGYTFDGTENLASLYTTGATGTVANGEYVTTSTSAHSSYRVNVENVNIPVADIGDIVYRVKSTGTANFKTDYFVYVGTTEGTKTKSWAYTFPTEYTTISTTDLWGLPSTWMSSINTLSSFRVQGNGPVGMVLHYDYIYVLGKDKDAGDNVLIDMNNPEGDSNNFKIVFDSTTTAQSIIDEVEAFGYNGTYYVKGLMAPDGTVLKGDTLIDSYVDDEDTLTVVWDNLTLVSESYEFNTLSDVTALRGKAIRGNETKNAYHNDMTKFYTFHEASTAEGDENVGYVTVNFLHPSDDASSTSTTASYLVQDIGINPFAGSIPAGTFKELSMRVRFRGDVLGTAYSSYKPTNIEWPELYWFHSGGHVLTWSNTNANILSLQGNIGNWIELNYTAEELGVDSIDVTSLRIDFPNYMPSRSYMDIDYIRFIAEPLPEVTVDMGDVEGVEDVVVSFTSETTVADVLANIDYSGNRIVVGLSRTKGGAALAETELIGTDGEDVTLYAVWGDNPWVGEFGELLFEVNFDDATVGTIDFGSGLNVASKLGGFYGKRCDALESKFVMNNGSGANYPPLDVEIVERASGDNYLKATTTAAGNSNLLQLYTGESNTYYSTDEGYLILTYDVLWETSGDTKPHDIAYNRSQAAEVNDQNERTYATQNGGWGYVVSTFDSNELGKTGLGGNSATMLTTNVNYLKIHSSGNVKAGETYGIDNIRLWWVPKTVNVTVVPGDNSYTTEQTFSVNPAVETVSDLIEKVNTGNADVALAGLSLTEGGELLASDSLLSFAYARTLYPKWSMPAQVTVDMGENTVATPVTMTYKGSNTIGDVIAKIVDHGDKKLVGLSRTAGGSVLPTNELIGTDSQDLTLYAVWEDYEFLENYGYEFNKEEISSNHVTTNNATRVLTTQDGYLTIDLSAKDGYTGTYDTQVYLPMTISGTPNLDKYVPAGVVTGITARVRFRGTGSTGGSYTVENRGTLTFDPSNPGETYIHWGAPGNTWGTNLKTYSYSYKSLFSRGIVDGQWVTMHFDTTSGNLNLYDNGVGFLRFDFPYPMPDGTKIDIDFIRLEGDNDLLPAYDAVGEYGEKVLEIDFDKYATGTQSFPQSSGSDKTLYNLGAKFNPAFNASNFSSKTIMAASELATEIVAHSDGTGNYLKTTANAAGTSSYLYFRNFEAKPFVYEDGYFVLTYDMKNESGVTVPHTFRFNYDNKVEHAADNIVITENGEWDRVTVYFDKEINPDKVQNGYTLDSTNDVTIIKWHNTSSVDTGSTISIDNLTLWYVPKTVPVIIDNSAIGEENTLIEEYPTKGMTNEELSALLPTIENGKFVGLSKTEGGDLVYENRAPVSQILYSNWSIDTLLTVDMGANTKLSDLTIQIPAGSSVKVSDIEAKFIDHGDKIFAGLSLTEGGEKLASTDIISSTESGAVTIYALWNDYYTNDFYSVEFDHNGEGVVTGAGEGILSAGKNSVYWSGSKDASGNATPGVGDNALVWNEEDGYVTMNFVASPYAKAQAAENGYSAIIWDPFMEIDTLYDATGDDTFLPAGDADYVVIRMRYRGMPSANTAYWRADTAGAYTLNPANVFAPYYFYTTTAGENFGSLNKEKYVSLLEGSAYRDNWFTVFIPASELTIDKNNVYRFRLDPNDGMPDGSAIDVDFIRFISLEEDNNFGAPVSREDKTSVRVANPEEDAKKFTDGKSRNGVRVLGEICPAKENEFTEVGWMFTASANWNKSSDGSERSWHELKMDLYDPESNLIKVGFTKENGELQVRDYFNTENDDFWAFTAVLYNIPVKNYKSPFIVRPFAKYNGSYAYGEPFEINFLDVLEAAANAEGATDEVVAYYNECSAAYAEYLSANAEYDSSEVVAALNKVIRSASSIKSNLIIPTNDTAPTVSGEIVTMKAWMNGSLATLNVSTKDTYPAIIDTNTGLLSDAYAEKPCVYYVSNGVYYIRSLGRSTTAGGDYNGVEKSDASAMEANVDGSALFLSEITNVESPFQRLPVDDELTNGKDSFFLGDFATGEFDFTFQRNNSATRTIATGKTGIVSSDSKVVAKYNFPNGTTEWVSFSQAQLLKMGLDSNNNQIADGIDFTNLTYVVSNNTTSVASGTVNQREYENLAVLAGVVDVPTTVNYTTTNFLAAKYNKVIVKTTSAASYVTVKFTRADGVSDSIKYYAYGTTADGYRLFDVDLHGMAKYHSTIKSLTVTANSGSVSYAYLVEDPEYYSSADLANMNKTMIFQDMNYDNGFYVRDMDQKLKLAEYQNYTFANNGNTPVWMIDPWYAYDYSDSANKSSYELYNIASPTGTSLADSQGTKVVKFNGTKTSTYADGSTHTGDVLSMTLNSRAIYDGKTHAEMVSAGMTYWPHLLIEQSREIYPVDAERNSAGADKIFLEMDIKMTDYTVKVDSLFTNPGTKQLSFLLYTYLRPKANPNDRIWFGAQLLTEANPNYPTWNRDTGASAYIYCIPQEVVFQGIANSFYQQIQNNIDDTSLIGGGTDSTSKDWVHVSLDVTPYIDIAIDWANREDAFGLGTLTRDDFYFDGVNIGFETHGNIDGTFEIANFNFVAYNEK